MQRSFSELEYASKKKVTRRDRFLAGIEAATPWAALVAELEAYYPRGGGRGRPPIGLERMLRMYVAQQCFGLSDEGIEDAVYDSQAIRRFVRIDLAREDAPDATTLLKFRRLLERHGLTRRIFEVINAHLAEQGLMLREGTIVDATLIAASPSTKNRAGARDPEMHQTRKGRQYYFGMKAHVGRTPTRGWCTRLPRAQPISATSPRPTSSSTARSRRSSPMRVIGAPSVVSRTASGQSPGTSR